MMRSGAVEWERKKGFVIRTLFDDLPTLSPVPEEDYSARASARVDSPLPPLIIEKEPNRHDEPEEFYKELEVKMHKLYRKLFLNDDSISMDDLEDVSHYFVPDINTFTDELSAVDLNEVDEVQNKKKFIKKDATDSYTEIIKDLDKVDKKANRVAIKEESIDSENGATLSEQSTSFQRITCVADVHQEASEDSSFSLVYEDEKVYCFEKSPILGRTYLLQKGMSQMSQNPDATAIEESEYPSTRVEENIDFNQEYINLDTSDDEENNRSTEIVRFQSVRRQSFGSIQVSGESSRNESTEHADFESRKMSQIRNLDAEIEEDDAVEESDQLFDADIKLCSLSSNGNNNLDPDLEMNISPPSPFKDGDFDIIPSPPPPFKDGEHTSFVTSEDSNETTDTLKINTGLICSSFGDSDNNNVLPNTSVERNVVSDKIDSIGITSTPLPSPIILHESAMQFNETAERELEQDDTEETTPIRRTEYREPAQVEQDHIKATSTPTRRSVLEERAIERNRRKRKLQQVNWEAVKVKLFVGTPKIFKLCPCKDHTCGD